MKTVFYKKVGRRYEAVSEYDPALLDALPKGTHVVMCYPGGKSTRYNVDANYAAMIAAGRLAEDAISKSIMDASALRVPEKARPLTPGQKAAWDQLVLELGDSARALEWASYREAAEAGVKAMQAEADKLMSCPAVRRAYDKFMLICQLTRAQEHDSQ
jgi:hypothetical protein